MSFSLSKTVVSSEGEQLYTFEYAALVTETSITLVKIYAELGVIEPIGSMLHPREIARIVQIKRLRQDLGLNLVGAAMVLDMAQEIAQLRVQLKVYQFKCVAA
ncbi:chaperone modulator CbpM [Limnofasciculus baicalensis]|uniref:Chaperone modulator CbpM n=1 Tax=Limnofasciculus baicalensis BBK-W-15 TaxID=2699891 RepID=A0AAE3KQD6_9CYAN|nr:chaperone modulator CbpM [Limnofasciculus baicalensis]MCP2731731.1 chaperone modulator CbpM [Limnofasciculus baicalensis BBK-W-15]